ncbi:glycosyltransferase [Soonwooa buanensis]|uniref:glycosyltransferase n=1 Tax=Soonwooa buanensis TaxID=619805 RepID=UPI0009A82B63|nr:glycosyltransferase [Soonwooa buanensis]
MKVLFISSWYPNKLEPTNGNFVQRHAEAVALQHHVEVLHAIGDPNQKEKFLFDEKVINGLKTLIVYYRNTKNPLINFSRRMKAYKLGFQNMQKPDIVHANVLHNNLFFPVYLKKKHKIPFVITEHWTAYQENASDAHGSVWRFFAKYIGNQSSTMMPVSKNLKRGLEVLGIKVPIHVISNVVNTDIFKINEQKKKHDVFSFVHISNLVERKNPDKIIEVAHRLHQQHQNFQLLIGGDGDLRPIQDLIKKLKAESYIKTFGKLKLDEVAEKMQESHAFILFSENETQGCVIVEANACGIPVISSAVGGTPEFVSPQTGILVERDNLEQLYDAMKAMLLHEKTFANPQDLHIGIEEKYSPKNIAKQYSNVYESVLKS